MEVKLLADHGYRAIAHDRRGHGRSSKTYSGNDMDTYARDLAELIEHLDLTNLVVIGHSTGGGEVVRYAAQHGVGRVAKVITAGAVPPLMVKTEGNPDGLPLEVFDGIRAGVLADSSQFYIELTEAFFGANREGSSVSEGAKREFWRQGMLANLLPCLNPRVHLLHVFQRVMPFDIHCQRTFEHRREHRIGTPLHSRAVGHVVVESWARQEQ